MANLVVGTRVGLYDLGDAAHAGAVPGQDGSLTGASVNSISVLDGSWWAISDERAVWRSTDLASWQQIAEVTDKRLNCLQPGTNLLIGTSEAGLLELREGGPEPVESFGSVAGRSEWYTPWGGPPDTRSISAHRDGAIYVNVHVGGVVRSLDGAASWDQTMDIDADAHQVLVDHRSGVVFAATTRGLALSSDAGETWHFQADGLHATYLRAVAVTGSTLLVSASTGPRGQRSAIYRRPLESSGTLERCRRGLPEWFDRNIDTYCLVARDSLIAAGTSSGEVFLSGDEGTSWERVATGLPSVQCLALG